MPTRDKTSIDGGVNRPIAGRPASGPPIPAILRELDASLKRLDRSSKPITGAAAAVHAAALAEEVDRLCWQLSVCGDAGEAEGLKSEVIARLDRLQVLIGVH